MNRGAWWGTVPGVAKSQDTQSTYALTYLNTHRLLIKKIQQRLTEDIGKRWKNFLNIILFSFFFFWLCWILLLHAGFLQLYQVRDYFLFVVHGLLIVMASLVAEHGLQDSQAQQLWLTGLVATRHVASPQTRD